MEFALKRSVGYGVSYAVTVFLEDKLGFNGKLNLKDFSYFGLSQLIVEIYRVMAPEHYDWAMEATLDLLGPDKFELADAFWRSIDTIASDKIIRLLSNTEPFFVLHYARYFKEFIAYYVANLVSESYGLEYNTYLVALLKKMP